MSPFAKLRGRGVAPHPGRGIGALLRSDTRRDYVPPTASELRGIDRHPKTAEETYAALRAVVEVMRAHGDPRAVFPDVYSVVTRNVAAEVAKGSKGLFREPAFESRLTGFFAERYFVALDDSLAGRTPASRAWQVAFEDAAAGATVPIVDAYLGINAHVNYDLAQGIVDNVRAASAAGAASAHVDAASLERHKHDHDAINLVLRASMPEVFDGLARVYGCRVTHHVLRVGRISVHDLALGTLQRWREDVWGFVLALLAAERDEDRAAVIAQMDRRSAKVAHETSARHERSALRRLRPFARAVSTFEPILARAAARSRLRA